MRKSDYILILVFILVAVFIFRECSTEIPIEFIDKNDPLKTEIKSQLIKKDSINSEVKKQDSVRVVYLTRWKNAKEIVLHDTVYKHDTVVKQLIVACDSTLIKDSLLIGTLKAEIKQDSLIIGNYQKVVKSDSITIKGLNKRRLRDFCAGFAAGFGTREFIKRLP